MSRIINALISIVAICFTIWVVSTVYYLGRARWQGGETIDVTMLVVVVLVLTISYLLTSSLQQSSKKMADQPLLRQKVQVYEEVIAASLTFRQGIKSNDRQQLKARLGMYANIKVLKAINEMEMDLEAGNPEKAQKDALIKILLAMRSDLAISNISIKEELQQLL